MWNFHDYLKKEKREREINKSQTIESKNKMFINFNISFLQRTKKNNKKYKENILKKNINSWEREMSIRELYNWLSRFEKII